jgi:hypothetical protein
VQDRAGLRALDLAANGEVRATLSR